MVVPRDKERRKKNETVILVESTRKNLLQKQRI
jgi:hypothetical protein